MISLNVFQRTSRVCQTPYAENFGKVFTGLISLNILVKSCFLRFDGVLNLSLHLPSVDFTECVNMLLILLL